MSELLNKAGTLGQDNLIAHIIPPAHTMGVKIAAGAGALKRGTVLAMAANGKYNIYGGTGTVNAVLAVDVDASGSDDVAAVAYRCGCFNRAALILANGYTLTVADEDALRKYDIILSDML